MTPMTNEEYVASNGDKCPFCNKNNLCVGDYTAVIDTTIYWSVKCEDCGKQWEDVFKLAGFEEFKEEKTKV